MPDLWLRRLTSYQLATFSSLLVSRFRSIGLSGRREGEETAKLSQKWKHWKESHQTHENGPTRLPRFGRLFIRPGGAAQPREGGSVNPLTPPGEKVLSQNRPLAPHAANVKIHFLTALCTHLGAGRHPAGRSAASRTP